MDELITSVLFRSLIFATPLFLATQGEILTEKVGILNLGMEGLIAFGAWAAFAATQASGSALVGILAALAAGAALASVHAFITVTFRANQVVSGLALTMIGTGAAGMWGKPFIGQPAVERLNTFAMGPLADIPFFGPVFFRQDPFFWISLATGLALWFLFRHTKLGLRLRAAGENPKAADSLGIHVSFLRWLGVVAGGALAGLAGAQLSLSYAASWTENMAGGRGWIVVALTIFALWKPLRAFWGALLFGGIFVLQYLLQPLGLPPSILAAFPYLATLIVLALDGLRKDSHAYMAPEALGLPFKRGER